MLKKNQKKSMYSKCYPFLLLIATIFMGIGYAAVNSVSAEIIGTSLAKANTGVFISNVAYNTDNLAIVENCKVNASLQTMLSTKVELSSTISESYFVYDVKFINNSPERYIYQGAIHDNQFYVDDNDQYNSSIIYEIIGIEENHILDAGDDITIQIRFRYSGENVSQNILNSYINFVFKKIYSVTYDGINGEYPTYAIEGENFVVDFSDLTYQEYNITMSENKITDYTFENNILTIPNVNGNVVIKPNIDKPPSGLIPDEKDFEVSFFKQGDSFYYMISLENITEVDSTGWTVYIEVPEDAEIVTFYNCNIEKIDNVLVITNAAWNGNIQAGSVGNYLCGFTISTSDTSYDPSNFTAVMS